MRRTVLYPEGPTYWGYGTTYQVILLAALKSALGDGLESQPKSRIHGHGRLSS